MSYEEYRKLQDRRARKFLSPLKDILAAGNLKYVIVAYDGGGDSGQFNFGSFKSNKKGSRECQGKAAIAKLTQKVNTAGFSQHLDRTTQEWVETPTTSEVEMWEWFVDAAHFAVSIYHAGWENNEGGFGTVRFTPEGIKVDHSEYVLKIEEFKHAITIEELPNVD
jgi:hypothetical protein